MLYHNGDANIKDEYFMAGGVFNKLEGRGDQGYGINMTAREFNEYEFSREEYADLLARFVAPFTRGGCCVFASVCLCVCVSVYVRKDYYVCACMYMYVYMYVYMCVLYSS